MYSFNYKIVVLISPTLGTQKLKWLGHVAIARWDEKDLMGWKYLGSPISIKKLKDDQELDFTAQIREVLRNEDHVTIISSLKPPDK